MTIRSLLLITNCFAQLIGGLAELKHRQNAHWTMHIAYKNYKITIYPAQHAQCPYPKSDRETKRDIRVKYLRSPKEDDLPIRPGTQPPVISEYHIL